MTQDPFGLFTKPPISIRLIKPDRRKMVVLGRVEDDPEPDFHVVGRTKCFGCDRWCYLGHETIKVVESGEATPFCLQCATPLMPKVKFVGRADDSGAGC